MSRGSKVRRGWLVAAALVATTALAACQSQPLGVGGVDDALKAYVATPNTVPGANDWNCKPSSAHPTPVVLVHATAMNLGANWVALSPMLKNAGYCVYALNYGQTSISLGRFGGIGEISASAAQLSAFVDKVLASTGAAKVDLVGHSQGGMMPSYYIKRLGGAAKVRTLIGIAPSNHGTTLSGLVTLGVDLNALGFVNALLWNASMPALAEQEQTSSFQKALFADGDTAPGVRYVVIETKYDHIVTPYTHAFLSGPNVTNILIQDQCPKDLVGHIGMFSDSPVLQNVLNQLGPNTPGFKATCSNYGLAL